MQQRGCPLSLIRKGEFCWIEGWRGKASISLQGPLQGVQEGDQKGKEVGAMEV